MPPPTTAVILPVSRALVREHMGEPPPPRPEERDPDSVVDGQSRPTDDTNHDRTAN